MRFISFKINRLEDNLSFIKRLLKRLVGGFYMYLLFKLRRLQEERLRVGYYPQHNTFK
ncbi:MAG: hypothetical protein AVDCRST_MAG95-2195 [uncultured Adhaeribacter sp.]|uniref:Uncharacterized protein n=1 Tax=uncultured Adhaeribacter sp. TaxID=448109 RepID=A0A6J4ISU8_9BACT|nr:MAG: hypothetical protein AVDCRST_MAG95-2195 [uncultured Adhaeribacter sp.]